MLSNLDEVEGISDSVRSRRASRRDGMIRTQKSVSDRDVARSQIRQNSRHEIRTQLKY